MLHETVAFGVCVCVHGASLNVSNPLKRFNFKLKNKITQKKKNNLVR